MNPTKHLQENCEVCNATSHFQSLIINVLTTVNHVTFEGAEINSEKFINNSLWDDAGLHDLVSCINCGQIKHIVFYNSKYRESPSEEFLPGIDHIRINGKFLKVPAELDDEKLYEFESHLIFDEKTMDENDDFIQAVPSIIRIELAKVMTSKGFSLFEASAVYLRRALEAICNENGFTEPKLYRSIEKLIESNSRFNILGNELTLLRKFGNEGAHDLTTDISSGDVENAILIIKRILDVIYVFDYVTNQFEQRRNPTPWKKDQEFQNHSSNILFILTAIETKPSLLLIDEIENSLHKDLVELIVDTISVSGTQSIISTHSPLIVDLVELDELRVITKAFENTSIEAPKDIEKLKEKLQSLGLAHSDAWYEGVLSSKS